MNILVYIYIYIRAPKKVTGIKSHDHVALWNLRSNLIKLEKKQGEKNEIMSWKSHSSLNSEFVVPQCSNRMRVNCHGDLMSIRRPPSSVYTLARNSSNMLYRKPRDIFWFARIELNCELLDHWNKMYWLELPPHPGCQSPPRLFHF